MSHVDHLPETVASCRSSFLPPQLSSSSFGITLSNITVCIGFQTRPSLFLRRSNPFSGRCSEGLESPMRTLHPSRRERLRNNRHLLNSTKTFIIIGRNYYTNTLSRRAPIVVARVVNRRGIRKNCREHSRTLILTLSRTELSTCIR